MHKNPNNARPSKEVTRRVIYLLAFGVALLALGAFTLSFDALRSLAALAGIRQGLTFLWPLVVDGFIVVATVSAVVMRDRGWRSAWYPWATLICFGTISVIGNALHAQAHASSTIGIGVAAMVSAVPAIALLLASHLFVLVMPRAAAPSPEAPSSPPPTKKPVPPTQAAVVPVTEPVTTPVATPEPTAPVPATVSSQGDEIDEWIARSLAAGKELTGAMVAKKFGVSPATGRRRLTNIRNKKAVLSVVKTGTNG